MRKSWVCSLAAVTLLGGTKAALAQFVGSPIGGPTPSSTLQMIVDEATGLVKVNGTVVAPIGGSPDGAPQYPTGGLFVGAGDIQYLEGPSGGLSDLIRIYPSAGPYGDFFSVWSDFTPTEPPDGDPFDAPFPQPFPAGAQVFPTASVVEPGVYQTVQAVYQFNSDVEVPEPATLTCLLVGGVVLLGRRCRRA